MIQHGSGPARTRRPVLRLGCALTAAAAALAATGTALATDRGTAPAPVLTTVARYTFDERGAAGLVDDSGNGHTLHVVASHGGAVRPVADGTGLALRFPGSCTGTGCPRVALQAASTDQLNPGRAPVRWGARVLLPPTETTDGENVIQKGYSAAGSQYKLQVDHTPGRPSCVLVDNTNPTIHIAKSAVTVADGRWHTVACARTGTALTITVDGVVRGTATVPATLSVVNTAPFSVGGKGGYRDNDQWQGTVDDVWLSRELPARRR
jgi:hypothetical protein